MRDSKKQRVISVSVALGTFQISFLHTYLSQLILSCFPSSSHGSNVSEYMGLAGNLEGLISVLQTELTAKLTLPYPHDLY
jgi:hypothetical protein